MPETAKSLREAITEQRPKNKRGFPTPLRKRVVQWSKEQLRKGKTKVSISKKLGISSSVIASWTKEIEEQDNQSSFLPIIIEEESHPQKERTFLLESPNGYRVKDLSFRELQVLLEMMG